MTNIIQISNTQECVLTCLEAGILLIEKDPHTIHLVNAETHKGAYVQVGQKVLFHEGKVYALMQLD